MKFIRFSTATLGCIAFILFAMIRWIGRNFGPVNAEQLLWNLFNGVTSGGGFASIQVLWSNQF